MDQPVIRKLSTGVVNKIAAGEVIERPSSVVKELLENSVDAGAARIDLTVRQGGTELIRVSDDGCGISAEQLPLAIASHATSKIQTADDLFQVQSLGFRGEALASISEVSHLSIRSRPASADAGIEMEVVGGRVGDQHPCGVPVGTTMEVRNLFFNTPVRRRFLRTTQTEMGHVTESFTRIALAQPNLHMTLRHNDRVMYDLPPVDRWRDRIVAFFGAALGEALIPIDSTRGDITLRGYVADPTQSRGNNRMQYLLLNGRYIRDRSLQHALGEAYRGLLLTGRYPLAFLQLVIPPEMVDVNVHPAKLEVRFTDSRQLYSILLGTLRNKFLTTDLTARAAVDSEEESVRERAVRAGHDPSEAQRHRQETMRWTANRSAADGPNGDALSSESVVPTTTGPSVPPFRPFGGDRPIPAGGGPELSAEYHGTGDATVRPDPPHSGPHARSARGLQVQNRYLVTDSDDGLTIIDQHALHERILYEQLKQRMAAGTLEIQRLLVPEPVNMTPPETSAVLENRDLLAQLGIAVEPFGGDTVLVSSYPAMLVNVVPGDLLRQLVEVLIGPERDPQPSDLVDSLLHMMSCKAAVKAGDFLAPEEISTLLDQRHLFHDTHHCPHGRPTALVFSNAELDKQFKRI